MDGHNECSTDGRPAEKENQIADTSILAVACDQRGKARVSNRMHGDQMNEWESVNAEAEIKTLEVFFRQRDSRQRLRVPLDLVNSGARINCRNRIDRRLFHDGSLKMLLSAPWRSTATMVPGRQEGKLTEITSIEESSEGFVGNRCGARGSCLLQSWLWLPWIPWDEELRTD
jgi:hypothetical protein